MAKLPPRSEIISGSRIEDAACAGGWLAGVVGEAAGASGAACFGAGDGAG